MATFRLLGGLAASELTVLSTEDVLLDRDCSCGRLLVSSSIYEGGKMAGENLGIIFVLFSDVSLFQLKMLYLNSLNTADKNVSF